MRKPLLRPPALRPGDTIGVFTPSSPANVVHRERYLHGLDALRRLGYRVIEGELTARAVSQGYRAGTPQERAAELMGLVRNPEVRALMATIGGSNSASLIPYLDFDEIRARPKILSGYSDVTSLHLAFTKHAGVGTFYGPAVVPQFGEWSGVLPETLASWQSAVGDTTPGPRRMVPPARWSNKAGSWIDGSWKRVPRTFEENPGWRVLRRGSASGPLVAANLNTLMSNAGTPEFPDLEGAILLIESMDAPISREERQLRQLERMGVFGAIRALLVGKPENFQAEGAPFGLDELILEIVPGSFPIVTGVDCSHTHPMLTFPEGAPARLDAGEGVELVFEGPFVV